MAIGIAAFLGGNIALVCCTQLLSNIVWRAFTTFFCPTACRLEVQHHYELIPSPHTCVIHNVEDAMKLIMRQYFYLCLCTKVRTISFAIL